MKRLALFSIVFIVCISLIGCACAYRSINGIRIQGKDVNANYSQLTQTFNFKGKELQATILRQTTFTDAKTAQTVPQIYNLTDIKEGELSFELNQK